ncbi:protease, partial [bacterium]
PVTIRGDFPEVRPEIKNLSFEVSAVAGSPTGQRVVVGARGRIFTVPADKGDVRQLEGTQGVHRRDPAWSPNGQTIAYITDEAEKQELALYDVATSKETRVTLGGSPSYYYRPTWSPDSTKITYTDVALNLWVLDVATGQSTKIDTGTYRGRTQIEPVWSPDSKWLAYNRDGDNHYESVYLYEVATGKKGTVTDGLAYANSPVFDRDGKHLYFLASTDVGVNTDSQDIIALYGKTPTTSVYVVVLKKGGPNPMEPESDEEPIKGETPAAKKDDAAGVIDLDGLEARTMALPVRAGNYDSLVPGPPGSVFILGGGQMSKFSFATRTAAPFASGIFRAELTGDGKSLFLAGIGYRIVSAFAPNGMGGKEIDLNDLRAKIDPKAEWRRMFNEVWRNERLMFYAPNLHGIDPATMEKRYAPFLDNLTSREDLNYLFTDMVGELSVGHMWARGGDTTSARTRVAGGLLGADFSFENGRYRITRVYDGERWNPGLYGPLAQPGVEAKVGEYLLAIDGKELTDELDIYETLEGKAGKQVRVKIGPTPDGKDAREAVVIPVGSEFSLRFRAWAEDNRRTVEKMTGGKIGYVHVPDTGGGGMREFTRYYYAQQDKQGMVVDDRFNHGGAVADYLVREMQKGVVYGSRTRYGKDWT